jgi:hypothetical protein
LSNIACHIVLPFVVKNPPTYFLATVLYTDMKRQCVMGRPPSLIGINRRCATVRLGFRPRASAYSSALMNATRKRGLRHGEYEDDSESHRD